MNDDGSMARMPDLERFAAAARAAHRHDRRSHRVSAPARSRSSSWWARAISDPTCPASPPPSTRGVYRGAVEEIEYLALTLGDIDERPVLVRVQNACILGDVFGRDLRRRCSCRALHDRGARGAASSST